MATRNYILTVLIPLQAKQEKSTYPRILTLGDVMDPTQIIEKPLFLPKFLPSEILRIMDT